MPVHCSLDVCRGWHGVLIALSPVTGKLIDSVIKCEKIESAIMRKHDKQFCKYYAIVATYNITTLYVLFTRIKIWQTVRCYIKAMYADY